MKHFVLTHFPTEKKKFKLYLKTILPMILGSTLFALNGVVDNFMVGHLNQGQAALGAINSWTSIIIGFFLGISAISSILIGQYYHAKDYKKVKEIVRLRFLVSSSAAILFAIFAWIFPDLLIHLFQPKKEFTIGSPNYAKDYANYQALMDYARRYLRIIAVQWILISVSFHLGNTLREIGHGKHTMLWGIGTLSFNIIFNATLMYGFNMEVEGAAIASIMGRVFAISYGCIYIFVKKLEVGFNPLSIFKISGHTVKLYLKRWAYFFSFFTVIFFVTMRTGLYSYGYDDDTHLGTGVTGLSVVALTGALISVFTTTFNALAAMSANFVASELGKGNLKQARINSDHLKGFNTFIAFFFSLALVGFASGFPYMHFFSKNQFNDQGTLIFSGHAHLLQVRNSMYMVALYYPIWIWFSTSYRNGNAGGKSFVFAFIDWIVTGPVQLAWLALMMFVWLPNFEAMQSNFWITYSIFFLSDLFKLLFMEIYYYKSNNWLHSITKTEVNKIKTSSKDLEAQMFNE